MKHVQACLSAREDRENSFHHCGGLLRLVQACFMSQGISRKQFSPLWRSCEARASLFMCGKDLITAFQPPSRCCEARAGLFMCRRRSRKQFSPLWRPCDVGAALFMCGKDLITAF